MKNLSKILALNLILLVVIFWMLSLVGISTASPQFPDIQQLNAQDNSSDNLNKPSNDSLAAILCDKASPYFRNLNPDSAQQNVTLHPIIKFDVYDDFTPKKNEWDKYGVNKDSIFISIKSRFWEITHQLDSTEITLIDSVFEVHCEYQPPQAFDWSDTVTCSLYVWDVSYLKNFADTAYTFYTIRDTMSPNLTPVFPESAMVGVPIDSGITIHGMEEGRGVVLNDIELWIYNSLLTADINGTPWDFTIYYKPDSNWAYNNNIAVKCIVHDLDGNNDTLDYWFKTVAPPDKKPPLVFDHDPAIYASIDTLGTLIQFKIVDDSSGVNKESISLSISINREAYSSFRFYTDGEDTVTVTTDFQEFNYNDTVFVKIYAEDNAGNHTDIGGQDSTIFYYFTVPQDTTSPIATMIEPVDKQNVAVTQEVKLEITDSLSGIDVNTISLIVSGDKGYSSIKFEPPQQVNAHTWIVTHTPESEYHQDELIKVNLSVSDKVGNFYYQNVDSFRTYLPGPDANPPVVFDHQPAIFANIDTLGTAIQFKITDNSSGVKRESISVSTSVNRGLYQSLEFEAKGGDTLKVTTDFQQFNYNDTVFVKIFAEDNAGNQIDTTGQDITVRYYFTVRQDKVPPSVKMIKPVDKQDVSVKQPVQLEITDSPSGVNVNSISLSVIGDKGYSSTKFDSPQPIDAHTWIVAHRPEIEYHQNELITVTLSVADLAGNTATFVDSFHTTFSNADSLAPIVYDHDPAIYGSIDTLDYSIQFKVRDRSGVNYLSIVTKISINGGPPKFLSSKRIVSVTGDTVEVENEQLHFSYNDSVFVEIYAEDSAGNHTDTTGQDSTVYYYFKVLRDTSPPIVKMIEPVTKKDVPVNQQVRLEITDCISGVDINTISVNISGDKGYCSAKFDSPQQIDAHTWIVTNTPETEYHEDELITVRLSVLDLAGNSTSFVDTFRTLNILANLYFISFSTSAGQSPVKEGSNVKLTANIACDKKDCPDSFSVCFFLNDNKQPLFTALIDSMKNGETLSFDDTIVASFGEKDTIMVEAIIDYYNNIEEANEGDNILELYLIKDNNKRAKLIVQPNPFTPNEDGFNDVTVFNFEQFSIKDPSVKIFDMHGRKIRELNSPGLNKNLFVWNGLDDGRRHLLPGMYLYIFSEGDNVLATGCIVIVR
jgi:hypothetical protein